MIDVRELMWKELRRDVQKVSRRIDRMQKSSLYALTTGGVEARTLANAPLAADGGMSDGTEYIDLLWISNGRKPGEGPGAGTGVLAYYNASADSWYGVHDYAQVEV